jgi:hypothetical protein
MTRRRQVTRDEEPIGIVISRGVEEETPPRFSAYVWGQYEEPEPAEGALTTAR